MSKHLIQTERIVHGMWKKGQDYWEEYRDIVRICRNMTRMDNGHLELNLARNFMDNKKVFFKNINSKRKTRENVGSLLNGVGALLMKGTEKAELLNQTSEISDPRDNRGSPEKGGLPLC